MDPELLERITARRAELDELEEQLARQLAEVRAERDELAAVERVLEMLVKTDKGRKVSVTVTAHRYGWTSGGQQAADSRPMVSWLVFSIYGSVRSTPASHPGSSPAHLCRVPVSMAAARSSGPL
ncbi:hypothetical protein GCM10010300_82500 [Streptomyces olivaceoviridis]|uniref:hypothetical protein n=1 Tax=Streptomyces olivaceoviridis TaxID=1921 RepID=UPI001675ABCC|nr:hypothetical protein [Streptomyces olivaceoviridis]GGZ26680.1 hypothetical protein GCM10010300_82500 [Streptomyces olivaceoviridis]